MSNHEACNVQEVAVGLAEPGWVEALLEGEWRTALDGTVRVHPYKKWGGAHWRLVSLAELGVTCAAADASTRAALDEAWDQVVGWLLGASHLANVPLIDGRYRRCGSQEGNALWAASTIGLGEGHDARARLAANLLMWQWPDGGWNCDRVPAAHHASFNESLPPLRGLVAFRKHGGFGSAQDEALEAAIDRAAEFFLRHRLVESERTGDVASPKLLQLAWPPYWHHDLLTGLRAITEAGRIDDPRAQPALDRLEALRGEDGRWHAGRRFWRRGRTGTATDLVAWESDGEARMLTAQASAVLAAAGRVPGTAAGRVTAGPA
jgi:hypothetical protein